MAIRNDPIADLLRLAEFAREAASLIPSGAPEFARLEEAIQRYATGAADSLDSALGLPEGTAARRARRDHWLHAVAAAFPSNSAKELAGRFQRYHATTWPRTRRADTCPHEPASLDSYWWHALRAHPVTVDDTQFRRITGRGRVVNSR